MTWRSVVAGLLLTSSGWADSDRARELLTAGRPAEAYESLVVELDGADADGATFELAARALLAAGRLVTAGEVVRRWIDGAPPEAEPAAYWYGGEVAARLQETTQAAARFGTYLKHAGAKDARTERALEFLLAASQEARTVEWALEYLPASPDMRDAAAGTAALLLKHDSEVGIVLVEKLLARFASSDDAVAILYRCRSGFAAVGEGLRQRAAAPLLVGAKRPNRNRLQLTKLEKALPPWTSEEVRLALFTQILAANGGSALSEPEARLDAAGSGNRKAAVAALAATIGVYEAHLNDSLHFHCVKLLLERGQDVFTAEQAEALVAKFAARVKRLPNRGLRPQLERLTWPLVNDYLKDSRQQTPLAKKYGGLQRKDWLSSDAGIAAEDEKSEELAVRTRAMFAKKYPDNREKKKKVDYRVRKDAERFLAEWQGDVPAGAGLAKSAAEKLAWEVCERHLNHIWHDGEAKQDWGRMWGPRLGPGPLFIRAAHAAAGIGTDLSERYVTLLQAGGPPSPGLLWRLTGMRDLGIGHEPFVPLPGDVLFDPELYVALLTKKPVWRRDGGGARFNKALWAYARGGEMHEGEYGRIKTYAKCHWQFNVSGDRKQAAEVVKQFLAESQGQSTADRINAINVFIDNSREATDLLTLDVLSELYQALPESERAAATAFEYVQQNVQFWLTDSATSATRKEKARALRDVLGRNLARGLGRQPGIQIASERLKPARDWLLARTEARDWEVMGKVIAEFAAFAMPGPGSKPEAIRYAYDAGVAPVFEALLEAGQSELAFVLIRGVRNRQYEGDFGKMLDGKMSQASVGLEVVPVDPRDPIYPLHLATREMTRGNLGQAWDLTAANERLLFQHWRDLSPRYVAWTIEQMRKYQQFEQALAMAFEFLSTPDLEPELLAQVSLTRGDAYRDSQNVEAARIEYQALRDSPQFQNTVAGQLAQSRMIELMITMRSYHNAEQLLEKLLDSTVAATRAEAQYLSARIAFEQEDYELAQELVEKTLKIQPAHARSMLLEGKLRLYVERGLEETEIRLGEKRLRSLVVPGRTLRLTLPDDNLSVARHSSSIPVRVVTKPGGDEELLHMYPAGSGRKLFVVTMPTTMATPKPGNSLLELFGDDEIHYGLDPEFQKEFGLEFPTKVIEVHAEGRLVASAGRILSEDEEEQLRMEQRLGANRGRRARNAEKTTTIRPGNPIYVQVGDLDRNISGESDSVSVRLETTSGDRLRQVLVETEVHSGMFRGEIATGISFPRAEVSDAIEGSDANAVISSRRSADWKSLPGSDAKWILVDTMTSDEIASTAVAVREADQIKVVRLEGSLRGDPVVLAQLPSMVMPDGLILHAVAGSGGRTLSEMRRQLGASLNRVPPKLKDGTVVKRLGEPKLVAEDVVMDGLHRVVTLRMQGKFFVAESAIRTFEFEGHSWGQDLYLLIDGTLILTQNNRLLEIESRQVRVELEGGVHTLEVVLATPKLGWEPVTVAMDGASLSGELFRRAIPEIAEALKPNVEIARGEGSFVANFRHPERLRKLRWVFENFGERALTVSSVLVKDAGGGTILPTDKDYTFGLNNETLEVAPGDTITVSYHDEKRLNPSAPYLYSKLDAAYNNGGIDVAVEVADGEKLDYYRAYRCRRGDTLMITVNDTDEDQSPERDQLQVFVATTGGETLTLTAVEMGNEDEEQAGDGVHTGTYRALLRLGDQTGEDMIRLDAGQLLTIGYLDRENLDPGVPFQRTVTISEAGDSVPELSVSPQWISWEEDTTEEAAERLERLRRKTYNKGRTDLSVWNRVVEDAEEESEAETEEAGEDAPAVTAPEEYRSSVGAALVVRVTHRAAALHAGSKFRSVKIVTASEKAAAEAESREPRGRTVSCRLRDLAEGVFGVAIPLRVGEGVLAVTADNAETATTTMSMEALDPDSDAGPEMAASTVAVVSEDLAAYLPLTVSGADTIYLSIDGPNQSRVEKRVHVASDAVLEVMDQSYSARSSIIHLGESFFLRLSDLDQDATEERDEVALTVTAASGHETTMVLRESFGRSGVFEGRLTPIAVTKEEVDAGVLQVLPGDTVAFRYEDEYRVRTSTPETVVAEGRIREGADGELAAFTKLFQDPEMAVKTSFLMAESLFEMAKERRKLRDIEQADAHIAAGKHVLEEAIRDFPDTELKAQGEFLLANLAEELGNYEEAIRRYAGVLAMWPDSEHAAPALFKKALCLEKKGEPEQALEEYVRLTYVYKNSPLAADAVVRMASFYYKAKNYTASAQIFGKFQANHPHHRLAAKSLALAGLSFIKAENYAQAVRCFDMVTTDYPDEKAVRAEAMYWLGDASVSAKNYSRAYRSFKQLTWDYPDSKWAKMARGRLTENVLLTAEERE